MRNKTDICQNEIRSVVNARLQPAPTLAVLQRREANYLEKGDRPFWRESTPLHRGSRRALIRRRARVLLTNARAATGQLLQGCGGGALINSIRMKNAKFHETSINYRQRAGERFGERRKSRVSFLLER